MVAFALDTARLATAGSGEGQAEILDLGCGDGKLSARLADAGASVTGVDASEVALEQARRAHPELELASPGDDGGLPFPDSRFDAVLAVHLLEHVLDTQRLVSEARRVLRPAGLLAVAVPWHGRLKNLLIAIGSFERHYDPLEPVVRYYTPRSLEALIRDFGFEDVRLGAAGGLPLARQTLLARARRGSP